MPDRPPPAAPVQVETERLVDQLGPLLTAVTVAWRRELAGTVSVSQAQLMAALRPGAARISQLARASWITGPSVTVMVGRLERAGLVSRRPDPSDRRSVLVELTPDGKRTLARISAARRELLRNRLQALSEDERRALGLALPALERLAREWTGGATLERDG